LRPSIEDNLEFEGHGLYLHREDFESALQTNALWVDVELKPEFTAINGRYVIVEGVFEAKPMGHSGTFRGAIRQVGRDDPMPTRAELARLAGAPP
jgi:hypothetical protein